MSLFGGEFHLEWRIFEMRKRCEGAYISAIFVPHVSSFFGAVVILYRLSL